MKLDSKNTNAELGTETKTSENFDFVLYRAFEDAFWIAASFTIKLPIRSPLYVLLSGTK